MKLNFVYYLLVFLGFSACKKPEITDPCVSNPIENNQELKRRIDLELRHNMDSCSVNQVFYNNEYFFVFTNSSPVLNYSFRKNAQIIDCKGADIAEYWQDQEFIEFFKTAKFQKTIWKKGISIGKDVKGSCNFSLPFEQVDWVIRFYKYIDTYTKKSLLYQYNYKGTTVYYAVTSQDFDVNNEIRWAAIDCEGNNLQQLDTWNQSDFLKNAVLEKRLR